MKLTLNQKIFLKINARLGKRPWLDRAMYFCGQWLIFIFAAFTGAALLFDIHRTSSWYVIIFCTIAFVCAFGLSYLVAVLFPHQRPEKELAKVKTLIQPLGTWKSFPSDHTIAATIFAFMLVTLFDETRFELWSLLALPIAVAVMFGRIYAGVHYPRDILGGIVFAVCGIILAVLICSRYFFAL